MNAPAPPARFVLDPNDTTTVGSWIPPSTLPAHVRTFGKYPNVANWKPGDLILVSQVSPGWVSRRIISGQLRGGYLQTHAQWHHAATYLGNAGVDGLCEATFSGVRTRQLYHYIGQHRILVRRALDLSDEERHKLAVDVLMRVGNWYGYLQLIGLGIGAQLGFWRQDHRMRSVFGARACVCSQLFALAYSSVTSKVINRDLGPIAPAELSATPFLQDVETMWLQISEQPAR